MTEVLETIEEFSVPLTVLRPGAVVRAGGYGAKSDTAVSGVRGHMQPVGPKEQRRMPEGMNLLETWSVWALSEIKEGDKITDGTSPTVVIVRSEFWKEGPFWHGWGTKVTDAP